MSELQLTFQWAVSTTVYAAGGSPWNGQPVNTPPVSDYWSPNTGLAANELNSVINQTTASVKAVRDHVATIDVSSWPGGLRSWANVAPNLMVHDPVFGRYLGFAIGGTGVSMQVAYDPAFVNATTIGNTLTAGPVLLGIEPSGGTLFAVENTKIAIFNPSTNTWTETSFTGSLGTQGKCVFFAGKWVYWSSVSTTIHAYYAAAAGTSAPTAATGTFPTGNSSSDAIHATDSATLLLMFSNADATHYASTTDGQTWTQQSLPTLSGGEAPIGAGYSATDGCFWLVTTAGSGSTTFWKSATGTGSWSQVAHIGCKILSFASRGHEWAIIANGSATNSVPRLAFSNDLGTTWYFPALPPLATSSCQIRGTSVGWMYSDGTVAAISAPAGYPSRAPF